jgi:hypothetical protein
MLSRAKRKLRYFNPPQSFLRQDGRGISTDAGGQIQLLAAVLEATGGTSFDLRNQSQVRIYSQRHEPAKRKDFAESALKQTP